MSTFVPMPGAGDIAGGLLDSLYPKDIKQAERPDFLDGEQRDAYRAMLAVLRQYGLESLAPKLLEYIKNGFSDETIMLELQTTSEWRTRFAANEIRKQKGLPVLSPAEYLATERSYRQIMSEAGLPVGFWDSQQDFTELLGNDMSPQELQGRVQTASEFVNRADPNQLAYMRQFYTQGDLIAFALDQDRAAPLVGKAFQASVVGGAAARQGLSIDKTTAESLAGLSAEGADQGFGLIAGEIGNANKLAQIDGEDGLTVNDLIDETFRADAKVSDRRSKLASRERGRFGGSSGVTQGTLRRGGGGV